MIDDASDLMTGVACFRGRAYAVDGQKKGLGIGLDPPYDMGRVK